MEKITDIYIIPEKELKVCDYFQEIWSDLDHYNLDTKYGKIIDTVVYTGNIKKYIRSKQIKQNQNEQQFLWEKSSVNPVVSERWLKCFRGAKSSSSKWRNIWDN